MTHGTEMVMTSLWRASWQGALAFLAIWLVCRLLARRLAADAHCWLWRLGYVKLLIGLLWGGAILLPLLSPTPTMPILATRSQTISAPEAIPSQDAPAAIAGTAWPHATTPHPGPRLNWWDALAAAYGIGVAVCLCRLLLATRRTRRVLQSAAPYAVGPETACAEGLASHLRLRRLPPLASSAAIGSPVLIAGKVLLPAGVPYTQEELRMILAHELAHARRRDLAWEWLGTLVQVVFFFHPLVVLARREERLAREAAADALALEATHVPVVEYGEMLLSLALGRRPTLAGAVGVIEGGTPLRRRLLALRDGASRVSTPRSLWRAAAVLLPLTALVLVPWQVTHGQAKPPGGPAIPARVAPDRSPNVPAGDKQIVGIVRDEAGKPVAGIFVGLVWETKAESDTAGQAVTDAQGRFTFIHLSAGIFDCQVSPETSQDKTGQIVPLTVPQSVHLTLTDSDTEKDLSIVVSSGALVTGRVVDAQTGKPIAGVFVNAGPVPPGSAPAQWATWPAEEWDGMTDAQGRYQVRVLPGNVFVRAVKTSGGSPISDRVRPAAQTGRVLRGQTTSLPDIPVSFDPVIVVTGPDGQPVANTPVRITPENLGKGGYIVDDHTDQTGTVVLSTFVNGTFSISQNGLYASGAYHWSPGQPLVIEQNGQPVNFADGVGKVQLTAGSSAVITGHVVSDNEEPIPNALVTAYELDPRSHSGLGNHQFRTDASGDFRASLDPNGEYQASVRADGYNQVMVSHGSLPLTQGQPTDLGTIHLVRADGFVIGRIVDPSGAPMAGVLAAVQGRQTGGSAALTDAQGRFRIPNIVPGDPLHLTLCPKGELVDGDSGNAGFQSDEQMDFDGVMASPAERQIVWHPHSGGY